MINSILIATLFFIEIYKTFYPNEYNVVLNVIKNDFKNNLEPRIIYIAFNIIYFYSCGEIFVNKIYRFIKPYIFIIGNCIQFCLKKYNIIDSNTISTNLVLEFFYEGNLVTSLDFDKNNKDVSTNNKAPSKYDFIVCSNINQSTPVNKLCVHNIDNCIDYDFETSDFMFISLRLFCKENNYTIELKNDKHNFYIVNNVLDKHFFTYYLKYILNLDNLEENITYKLELVDQDVNVLLLTDKDKIVLNKQDYTIVNNEDIK
jgi:hypothetical protein